MKNNDFNNFIGIVDAKFPEVLTVQIDHECCELKRQIIFIKPDFDKFEKSLNDNNNNLLEYDIFKEEYEDDDATVNNLIIKEKLNKYINLLDRNLGKTYEKLNKKIYDNNKLAWKENKWEEMVSPSLIYVSYHRVGDEGEVEDELLLYTSFMFTEESDISMAYDPETENIENVIYLYEIQLDFRIRGEGIGRRMIICLGECGQEYNRKFVTNKALDLRITSIALTVFSENVNAIKFYNKLGFGYTTGSPRDEIKVGSPSISHRTRNKIIQEGNEHQTAEEVIKPIYYILYKSIL